MGYAWRPTRYGTVNNVAGNTGLQLQMTPGKKVVLGTQKVAELNALLEQKKKRINN